MKENTYYLHHFTAKIFYCPPDKSKEDVSGNFTVPE